MQNMGMEEFSYDTFKMNFDSDPVIKALVKRFDQNGVELNTKRSKEETRPDTGDKGDKVVSQMAKRATARAQA
jgi:hypothetical protein